tara:strand:+ start:183 stop:626 length:444 start_codon:yes stop_codon:yes gene_type:complete
MNNKWRNFVVGATIHEGIKEVGGKYIADVKDLTMEMIKDIFINKYQNIHFTRNQPDGMEGNFYRDSVGFPTGEGSSASIGDVGALESWKSKILNRYGNVEVIMDPTGDKYGKYVKIKDPKFQDSSDSYNKGVENYYKSKGDGDSTGD